MAQIWKTWARSFKPRDIFRGRTLYQRSLALREKNLPPDHPDLARSLNRQAALYRVQGLPVSAEPLYRKALAIFEKALGANDPNTASSLNNLAECLSEQGKYASAEPLYVRSLAILEDRLGADHLEVVNVLNNLGDLYRNQRKFSRAEHHYLRALAGAQKSQGSDHIMRRRSVTIWPFCILSTRSMEKRNRCFRRRWRCGKRGSDHDTRP